MSSDKVTTKDNLSYAEIWDDTDLQTNWNESLAEYQRYHSIHARGDKVDEVLKAAIDAQNENVSNAAQASATKTISVEDKTVDIEMNAEDGEIQDDVDEEEFTPVKPEVDENSTTAAGYESMSMPQAMITQSTHDQGLKDLMMSWYWAGYYTGFYEGKQQAEMQPTVNGC